MFACKNLACQPFKLRKAYAMVEADQLSEDDDVGRRASVLRELCQGEGLTIEKLRDLPDRAELFGSDEPQALADLIRQASRSLLDDDYAKAIVNALNLDEREGNLTERRYAFAEREDVKPRTLINHEQRGAELLARQIDVVRSLQGGDGEVRDLRNKLKELEDHVYATNLIVSSLLELLVMAGVRGGERLPLVAYDSDPEHQAGKSIVIDDKTGVGIGEVSVTHNSGIVRQLVLSEGGLRALGDLLRHAEREGS